MFGFEALAHLSAVSGAGVRGLCVRGVIEWDRAALQIPGTVVRERWPTAGSLGRGSCDMELEIF